MAMVNELIGSMIERLGMVVRGQNRDGLAGWFYSHMNAIVVTTVTEHVRVELRTTKGEPKWLFPSLIPTEMKIVDLEDLRDIVLLDWRTECGGTEQSPNVTPLTPFHSEMVEVTRSEQGKPLLNVHLFPNTRNTVHLLVNWLGPLQNVPGRPELPWKEVMKDVFEAPSDTKSFPVDTETLVPTSQLGSTREHLSKISSSLAKISTNLSQLSKMSTD